jgi:hypothetical protein
MHTPWRNVSKHVMILDDVRRATANLGWRYVSRKGRLGSTFERHRIIADHGDGKAVASGYVAIAEDRNDVPPDHDGDWSHRRQHRETCYGCLGT